MGIRIAINGFGRIGRCVARQLLLDSREDIELVAVNDLADAASLAYLFEFDSVHRRFALPVHADGNTIVAGTKRFDVLSIKDPTQLPWKKLGVDVVLECTGRFKSRDDAATHLDVGARRVVISAPPQGPVDRIFCMGVNDDTFDPKKHFVVSNASCTTNCLAPMLAVLESAFGIVKGHMLTVHSYTADQSLVDTPHKSDPRRGRTAGMSMIPTSSGVTKAIYEVLPSMTGKIGGSSIRVPTPDVSIVCLTASLAKKVSADEVNQAMRIASSARLSGILRVEDRPLVSADLIGDPCSSIVDAALTEVVADDLVEVQSWYDNEWGFSARMLDLVRVVAR